MIHGQGEMEQTAAGAKRESNKGRGRFDLIPYEAVERLAIWYELGAEKYAERNWEQGLSVKDCVNRMVRHALKVASGRTDEDHLAAVMWNAAAIITMQARKPELDDHCWHYPEGVAYQSPTAEYQEQQRLNDIFGEILKLFREGKDRQALRLIEWLSPEDRKKWFESQKTENVLTAENNETVAMWQAQLDEQNRINKKAKTKLSEIDEWHDIDPALRMELNKPINFKDALKKQFHDGDIVKWHDGFWYRLDEKAMCWTRLNPSEENKDGR